MTRQTTTRVLAAAGLAAMLAACSNDPYADRGYGVRPVESGVVDGAVRPTPENPSGGVYVTDDGETFRCEEGLVFDC